MNTGYMTLKETSEVWGISTRRINTLCVEGRIPGATRMGNMWVIPEGTEKPSDGRITTGEYRDWRKKVQKLFRNDRTCHPRLI